jgi:hypothetical protein
MNSNNTERSQIIDLVTNKYFWILITTILSIAISISMSIYSMGKDSGHTIFDKEKNELFCQNTRLKSDSTKFQKKIDSLLASIINNNINHNSIDSNFLNSNRQNGNVSISVKNNPLVEKTFNLPYGSRIEIIKTWINDKQEKIKDGIINNVNITDAVIKLQKKMSVVQNIKNSIEAEKDLGKAATWKDMLDGILKDVESKINELDK